MVLKEQKAQKLLEELIDSSEEEEQYLLARITGNFKRGNEKLAKFNPKNR
ncbi:ABC transporter ATP-binding protein [Paraliobacillus zengyii]|nr:ABC transporter ATP-binding protein [Paraliobacillus zengyii]